MNNQINRIVKIKRNQSKTYGIGKGSGIISGRGMALGLPSSAIAMAAAPINLPFPSTSLHWLEITSAPTMQHNKAKLGETKFNFMFLDDLF